MRSPPARRAAVVALASASSAGVWAAALAKAGAASIALFIMFPPLSRPGIPPETTKTPALVYRLPRRHACTDPAFAAAASAAPLNAEARDGLLPGERPAAMKHAPRSATRWAAQPRMHPQHMTRTHAAPSDERGAAERDGPPAPDEPGADGLSMDDPAALERGDVDGLGALVAGLGVVGHLRALSQRLEAVGVDAGVMDEEVLAALVRGHEAEALVVVEPLHGSGSHDFPPRPMCTANAEEAATATTAGAEHSVVERGAPDLDTTQRTARISDLQQHRPRRAGLGRRPWRNNVCCALSPHSRRGEGEAFSAFADSPYAMARLRPTRLGAVEPADASGRAGARPLQS